LIPFIFKYKYRFKINNKITLTSMFSNKPLNVFTVKVSLKVLWCDEWRCLFTRKDQTDTVIRTTLLDRRNYNLYFLRPEKTSIVIFFIFIFQFWENKCNFWPLIKEFSLIYFLRFRYHLKNTSSDPKKSRISLWKLITFDPKNQFQQNKQIKLKLSNHDSTPFVWV